MFDHKNIIHLWGLGVWNCIIWIWILEEYLTILKSSQYNLFLSKKLLVSSKLLQSSNVKISCVLTFRSLSFFPPIFDAAEEPEWWAVMAICAPSLYINWGSSDTGIYK